VHYKPSGVSDKTLAMAKTMSYHDALNYLVQKTSVIELFDQLGGRLAVCPEWNGRVFTSTDGGLKGDSFGSINIRAIDAESYENFGGEDQWTLSPLIYSFAVESIKENQAVLQRAIQIQDANGVPGDFQLTRSITLLSRYQAGAIFGDAVADALKQSEVSAVGFSTESIVRTQRQACLASRQRGMFNASPNTAVIIPIPSASFTPQPFSVDINYLGGAPHKRIRRLPQALLIRADGKRRCQVTIPFAPSLPIFGAVELRQGTLTLWTFDLPQDSDENDMIRIYIPGRIQGDESNWATYYEVNCFSAARELRPDDALTYWQCTLHLNADNTVLASIVQQTFGVSLEDVSRKMLW
jgi:hypothetical protein